MRPLLSAIVTAGSLTLAIAAFAQSTTPPPAPAVPANPTAAAPVASGKRFAVPNRITGNERSGAKRSDAALHGTGSS
jgi:hypothetical protein